jgi:hypothetical protein
MNAVQIKLAKLVEWKQKAAGKVSAAFTKAECDSACAEYRRAVTAYDEHCREYNLDPYAPKR